MLSDNWDHDSHSHNNNDNYIASQHPIDLKNPQTLRDDTQHVSEIDEPEVKDFDDDQNVVKSRNTRKSGTKCQDIEPVEPSTVEQHGQVSPPSTTYFSIGYTGQFTSITDRY